MHCSTEGCDHPVRSRTLCSTHYRKARDAGELDRYPTTRKHVLTEVDVDARTAVCAECGPVGIKKGGSRADGWRCRRSQDKWRAWGKGGAQHYPPGVTREQRREIVDAADGCQICGRAEGLVLDHCHAERKIRGVLCQTCNAGLGFFRDSPDLLLSAAAYLQK